MVNPVTVFSNIHTELTQTYNLPFTVTVCVKALTMVHWVWWLRRKNAMVKPENIVPALIGTGLDVAVKFTPQAVEQTLRGIAKLILLATRIDECREKMQSLADSFETLKNACTGKYLPFIEPQWTKKPESIILSAQTINGWSSRGKNISSSAKRIYYSLLLIFTKVFKLSMHIWDVYHAIIFSHDDMPEVVVNGMIWWRKIRNNQEFFNQKLKDYEPLIQNIFDATKVPPTLTAHQLIKKSQQIFDKIDFGVQQFDNFNRAIGEAIIEPIKDIKNVLTKSIKSKKLLNEVERPMLTRFTMKPSLRSKKLAHMEGLSNR